MLFTDDVYSWAENWAIPLWNQLLHHSGAHVTFLFGRETEQIRDTICIWQLNGFRSEFIEDLVGHCWIYTDSLSGVILQHFRDEVYHKWVRTLREEIVPAHALHFWKLFVLVVWIHCSQIFLSWRPQLFYNFYYLCVSILTLKERCSKQHLCHNAACRPDIDGLVVFVIAKDEFRCSVVAAGDVGDARVVSIVLLSRAKVTYLQNVTTWVNQEIVRLDISVHHSLVVNEGKTSQ